MEPPDGETGEPWSDADMLLLNLRNDQYFRPERFPDETDLSDIRGGGTGRDGRVGREVGGGGLDGNGGQTVKKW